VTNRGGKIPMRNCQRPTEEKESHRGGGAMEEQKAKTSGPRGVREKKELAVITY